MVDKQQLEARIIETIKTIYDPEIPVDIWELGLIYGIDVSDDGAVVVRMTLTSPNCPVAESLPTQVEQQIKAVEDVAEARVQIVWDPPWCTERMSEAAKLELNLL